MRNKKVIVHTAGTFDLFHIGHLNILKKSKELGDYLIVAVSSDELVESYKGIKPVVPYEQRARIIESIKFVDKVIKQDVLHDIKQLKRYKVDITTIGDDWKDKYLEGLEWMKKNRKVVYFPYTKGVSVTQMKKQIIGDSYNIVYAQFGRDNGLSKPDTKKINHQRV